ncbi:MAG TPA: ribosomal protein S18-alanine N-acetyltransferase [Terracidiphilus sp.]|nr:ribosomal protein S18-alanine N-acetyltransferase [Terracidiphilus sp.]
MTSTTESAQVRRMTAADLTQVLEIAASLKELPQWPESAYLNALNSEATLRRIALVAAGPQTDRVEGFAVASAVPPEAELELIAVAAGSQRRGLGRMLLDGLRQELRAAGAVEIALEVRASNHAALVFYRSAGFGEKGLRRGYYVDPIEDAVLMRLKFC